jgi:hypothetical protein
MTTQITDVKIGVYNTQLSSLARNIRETSIFTPLNYSLSIPLYNRKNTLFHCTRI